MKNSILIKRVILVFCMISIMIIGSGCAAKKTVLENQGKTECYLDEKDATKFIYNGQQYTILNNTVDKNSLGDWIGFIQKYVALDENYNILKKCDMGVNVVGDLSDLIDHTDGTAYYVPYLNVYKTENEGDMNNLVVDVDNDFHKAIPSENAKDGDFAYGHFPRPSGPRSPARQGHIKRPVLRLAEPSFLRPANQCC